MAAQDPPTTSVCPTCSARLRPVELWCSLCHTRIRAGTPDPPPDPAPDPATDPVPTPRPAPRPGPVPAPRPAPDRGSAAGPLVGGRLPPHVLAQLDAGLAAIADRERALRTDSSALQVAIDALRGRPAVGATVAGAGVLVVLLLAMWIIGRVV